MADDEAAPEETTPDPLALMTADRDRLAAELATAKVQQEEHLAYSAKDRLDLMARIDAVNKLIADALFNHRALLTQLRGDLNNGRTLHLEAAATPASKVVARELSVSIERIDAALASLG